MNANGIQDSGETGFNSATVNYRDSTGNTILQTATTNSSGSYNFAVAPGSYILEFAPTSCASLTAGSGCG